MFVHLYTPKYLKENAPKLLNTGSLLWCNTDKQMFLFSFYRSTNILDTAKLVHRIQSSFLYLQVIK